ncbi:hypothetical protein [Halomonas sp. DQ26W]|nr:hypothetical protein [Halomonas sp. DQ26W]
MMRLVSLNIAWELTDRYRLQYSEVNDRFNWFDYRSRGFERQVSQPVII